MSAPDRFTAEAIDEELVRQDAERAGAARTSELLLQLAAARAIIRELQGELAQIRSDHAHALERLAVLQDTLLARTTTLHLLESALAAWAPLQAAYDAEMGRRAASGFKVEPHGVWVADLARRLGGTSAEDGGAVSDRHNEYAGHGD